MEAADFLPRRFQNLRINTPSTPPQTSHLSERLAAQSLQRKLSSTPPVSENASTPPISVTPSGGATVSRFDVSVHGDFGRSGNPLQQHERSQPGVRRKSISFAPNVRLDSGQQLPLQQPLPRNTEEQEEREDPVSLQIYGSSPPSSQSYSFNGIRRGSGFDLYDSRSEDGESESSRNGFDSAVSSPRRGGYEGMGDRYDKDRMGSLTSASTASPMLDEVKTPPTNIDSYLAPIDQSGRSPSSLHSLQEEHSAPWPWMSQGGLAQRSKSFSVDKPRRTREQRKASMPTPNSPASQFLRSWKTQRAPQPNDEGQAIGDYIIGKTVGFGGYSVVKEAHTLEKGRKICRAVKIVKKKVRNTEAENDAILAEFEHEVNLWRHLSHRYILDLLSVYDTSYAFFCITRYNIGGTLFDLVKKNRDGVELHLVRKYAYQLSSALRYLHQDMRVVHRDVKLENVLLNTEEDPTGQILLCDFGMAEFLPSSHPDGDSDDDGYDLRRNRPPIQVRGPAGSSTAISSISDSPVTGSLQYAAPELIKSDVPIIHTYVDMWALGVTIYTMITGRLPFQHNMTGILQEMILKGKFDKELLLSKIADDEAVAIVELLEGLINMDANERWDVEKVLESKWLEAIVEKSP